MEKFAVTRLQKLCCEHCNKSVCFYHSVIVLGHSVFKVFCYMFFRSLDLISILFISDLEYIVYGRILICRVV
jgi:hypothetical protein